ncbi:DEAD/DEAH box domain containing protein, putative [Babesia bigemina]|uniref:ATP-dependent RNA helicase n=1 Tax=Babesia bigemina TaxID=5866 RepID=A0A061DD20_BABBI|nr:DEAD/DEAH box domain containing protein, putative [Babesia bigemina]CDR97034.1 DEAD/DEAH box domain containing protein, putative [Babesia bigemina]|eukprot:XP_012769220.1 DEAD/DEAH box domain containing protein, putative [Babesia bigemina]
MKLSKKYKRLQRIAARYKAITEAVTRLEHVQDDDSTATIQDYANAGRRASDATTHPSKRTNNEKSQPLKDAATTSSARKGAKRQRKADIASNSTDGHQQDRFEALDIDRSIVEWLKTKNILVMTRVQKLAIPKFMKSGTDVLVQSHTGSGKTLCFVVPILDMFMKRARHFPDSGLIAVFAVIMLPTRELATQVHSVVSDAIAHMESGVEEGSEMCGVPLSCLVLIGGSPVEHDVKAITKLKTVRGARPLVIATPGRLHHLIDMLQQEMLWTFKDVTTLVLDEADRLLEMGYQADMTAIMGNMPKQRKTGFFSATLPKEVLEFAKMILNNYHFINADDGASHKGVASHGGEELQPESEMGHAEGAATYATPVTLKNYYLILDPREKLHFVVLLLEHLRMTGVRKCAIFFLTCDLVDYFSLMIAKCLADGNDQAKEGVRTILYKIHRKMPTARRQLNLDAFRKMPDAGVSKTKSDGGPKRLNAAADPASNTLQVLLCTDIFSRGIDIPQIEWVIQYDAPQDPNFYVHRIGRVSRAGASGNAILLLNNSEEAYVQFQINRKIPLMPLPSKVLEGATSYYDRISETESALPHHLHSECTTVANGTSYIDYLQETAPEQPVLPWIHTCKMLSYIRAQLTTDRALLLTATKAFVSYTRAYSEHRLKSIFEQKNVDYGALATSFGVLKVPRVKEILGKKLQNFANSDTDVNSVAFKNEGQERDRLKKLQQKNNETKPHVREKKPEPQPKVQRTRSEKRVVKRENALREWEELAREEALAKKLKKRKITREQYEKLLSKQEQSDSDESDTSDESDHDAQVSENDSDWETELDNFVKEWKDKPKTASI